MTTQKPPNKIIRNSNYVGERKVCVCVHDDYVYNFRIARKLRGVINNPFTLTFFFLFSPQMVDTSSHATPYGNVRYTVFYGRNINTTCFFITVSEFSVFFFFV